MSVSDKTISGPDAPDEVLPLPGGESLRLRPIPAGTGWIGSRGAGELNEEPRHRVRFPRGFYLGKFVVTQAQWRALVAITPALRDGVIATELPANYHERLRDWGDRLIKGRHVPWTKADLEAWLAAEHPREEWELRYYNWGSFWGEATRGGAPGAEPSSFKNDLRPVEQVSWDDASAWCRAWMEWVRVSEPESEFATRLRAGWELRLPTEAEWEYACRAGRDTEYYNGDGEAALAEAGWYDGNSSSQTHPADERVGGKVEKHPWGLVGMHGNVWEWCRDVYRAGAYRERMDGEVAPWADARSGEVDVEGDRRSRVMRGGSWDNSPWRCRSAYRYRRHPGHRLRNRGFRLCLAPGPAAASAEPNLDQQGAEAERSAGEGGRCTSPESLTTGPAGAGGVWPQDVSLPDGFAARSAARKNHNPLQPALTRMSLDYLANQDRVIDCPKIAGGKPLDWEAFRGRKGIRKIVIGQVGRLGDSEEDKKKRTALGELPADFATLFPDLTHLYLWNCTGFTILPKLPDGLQCLDVRGCVELTTLPDLPETLETLDLGGCGGLAKLPASTLPALERFYFNDCANLKSRHVEGFLEVNLASPLVEIDGSRTAVVVSLADFPRKRLRKLVLKGCTALTDAKGIGEFAELDHLNLAGCSALQSLPDLPPKLRYLELYGATSLRDFMGQSLAPSELGTESGVKQNVAKAFKTLKKFGAELAVMPHAKLLLLGDGRVGKTTLAKRLIWTELSAEQRKLPENAEIEPKSGQRYTNSVEFRRWQTEVDLPDEANREKLSSVPADVRLWDFGGQEIYHRTHRIFAGEGSVFLIVWSATALTGEGRPTGVSLSEDVWKEVNAPKSLDYWVDYLATMRMAGRPEPEFGLLCTLPHLSPKAGERPDWRKRAPLLDKSGSKAPEVFYIDTLDPRCAESGDYLRLRAWIRGACGRQASTIGVRKPRFFTAVARMLDGWLAENSAARSAGRTPSFLLREAGQWRADVVAAHAMEFPGATLRPDADDVEAVTGYLHDCGQLFRLRSTDGDVILVDQQWAAGVIYGLLDIQAPLWALVREQGGYFTRLQLEVQPVWERLRNDAQRERLLAYMLECGTVVRIADADRSGSGQDLFLATDKWLLPPRDDVNLRIQAIMEDIETQHGVTPFEKFEFENVPLNEFDFRSVQTRLAREFGTGAIYFRDGIFAHHSPDWCFLLTWGPKSKSSRAKGYAAPHQQWLDGTLLVRAELAEALGGRITEIFYGECSPLGALSAQPARLAACEIDMRQFKFPFRPDGFEAGLSSCGADTAEAMEVYKALGGFSVDFYQKKRPERLALGVFDYMKQMVSQPCIVLLLSERYLSFDPTSWHCAWELADAVCRLADGRRNLARTIVIYKNSADGTTFNSRNAEAVIHTLFVKLRDHFAEQFRSRPPNQWDSFKDEREFAQLFDRAATECGPFFAARTTKGSYLRAAPPGTGADYTELVAAMKAALGENPS